MNKAIFLGILILAVLGIAYLAREPKSGETYVFAVVDSSYSPGDLYSVQDPKGFKVVKILADEKDVVHVRSYKNTFLVRPTQLDPAKLTMGSITDSDGFGIGHMPVSKTEFSSWKPQFIQHSSIKPEELEGYELWKKSNGGVFGN